MSLPLYIPTSQQPRMAAERWVFPGLGALLIVLGDLLVKVKRNGLVGIRTPWSMASDEVWEKTHRLARVTVMAGGALLIGASLLGAGFGWLMAIILASVFIPAIWSYIYSREA